MRESQDAWGRGPRCRGHLRHWFTVDGHVGLRSPKCVRCGAPNPKPLTTDDWHDVLRIAPHLVDDPEGIVTVRLADGFYWMTMGDERDITDDREWIIGLAREARERYLASR